jgi:hypothetical protein
MELGFAAGILGWDNVICIMDKDFGEVTELPFDLQHRRITPYSLNGKDKSEERKRIRDIISSTVMNLIESGPRAKKGMSLLKVGSYVDGSVSDKLIAYEPFESAFLSGKIGEYVSSCKKLISEISKVKLVHQECEEETGDPLENITKPRLKRYSKEDEEFYRELAKSELGEDLSVDFFETGGLKSQVNLIDRETVYVGTEEEKLKVEKIEEFQIQLSFLYMLDSYWKIYDELVIFPLAIENVSSTSDTEISIYVKIKNESAEIINADKKLIPEVCVGIEGLIYEHAYIKDILMMTSDNDITYDEDISYDFNDNIANFKRNNIFSLNQQTPKYDASDYEREIKKYFAPAMENSRDTYEFFIRSIRAHEKVWIGPAILLRPLKEEVELSYGIKSNKSDGSIKGTLKYVVTKE